MATRRQRAKGAAGGKRTASRRTANRTAGTKRRPAARRGRKASSGAGTREARAAEAARNIESAAREPPVFLVAEPAREEAREAEQASGVESADRAEAAALARAAAVAAEAAEEQLRSRVAAASRELGRRREDAQAEGRRMEDARELPGMSAFAMELAIGALRLVRTILTAPLRIGLAFLRPREA
ncbi:MAG TPA: hypothetical protein VF912_10340 [Anaeromyxobacter sp.]